VRVTVLGSGTLLPSGSRGSASHLVQTRDAVVLLDCGAGCLRGLAAHARTWDSLTHVIVSHFHVDHVGALASLLWAFKHGRAADRVQTLHLVGPAGLREHLLALSEAHGEFVVDPGMPIEIVELPVDKGSWDDPSGRFRLVHGPTPHTENSLALRLETDDGSVGYTGDTGPDRRVADLLRGVDLLIAECSRSDRGAVEGHLSPSSLADLLERSRPGLALITHVYPGLDPGRIPDLVAAMGYTGSVVAASDGTSVHIEGGSPRLVG
jgi:ribonuclease BN (tRNA processing enzyme)